MVHPSELGGDKSAEQTAVLCGAGVSCASGLPIAKDCEALLTEYAADDQAETDLPDLLKPRANDAPWLRFEGIMAVFQEYIDASLSVLDVYKGGNPRFNHAALARIARHAPVLTTNFDNLIERAALDNGEPIPVAMSDDDFKNRVSPGVWKLHGTLQV